VEAEGRFSFAQTRAAGGRSGERYQAIKNHFK
jgi:hypothetical protein